MLALAAVTALPILQPASALAGDAPTCAPGVGAPSAITSNFNGTAIPAGRTIWFSSVFKATGLGDGATTIRVVGQSIELAGSTVSVPDAVITLSPSVTTATTTVDPITGAWTSTVPTRLAGNTFLSGLAVPIASDLAGGAGPVTWHGTFFTDTQGVRVNWQWAAAVYTAFGSANDALGVKPTDDNKASIYANSDHAGTPERFKQYVTGGARGGGGANATGSHSSTAGVVPCLGSAPDPDDPPIN
jgi:hypothetical protein